MSDIVLILGGIVAGLLAILGYGQFQKREGQQEAENNAIQDDLETAKRIDAVRNSPSADSARERLRQRRD